MFKRSLFVLTPIALALAVSACGDDGHQRIETVTTGPAAQATGDTFLLEGTQIRSFNRSTIGASTTEVSNQTITGLAANEVILGVDVRPATGELIALSNTGAIYSLDGTNGRLTLKSTLNASAVNTCTPAVAAFSGLSGTEFGVDVNSAVTGGLDRLRIVSDTGQNLRVDMDNGAVTVDCPISNGTATAAVPTAIAYTNAFGAANTTKLYYIDSTSNQLLVNNGTPNNGAVSVVGPLGVDVTAVSGFDIDGYNGTATAVFTVGSQTGLYTINLTTGAATARNVFTDNLSRRGLAFKQPGTPTVYAVTSDNMLLSFAPRSPSVAKAAPVAISGLAAGENVVDIDFRPATGQLYGLTSASKVYVINPTTGAASSAQTLSTALTGAIFGVDFNPISDRLRTVSDTKQNLSSNVADGLTTMDSPLTTTAGGGNVVAAAYTNNWAKPAVPASTKLFYLDIANDKLVTTADPSTGMLTDVGTLGVAAEGDAGFDIVGGHDGLALASLATAAAGPSSLYYVDLATGAATPVVTGASQIGGASGSLVRGIAVEIINPAQ